MCPTCVQQGKLHDIAPGLPSVDFTGTVTPFLSGFQNVFLFPNTLRNILSLLELVGQGSLIDVEVGRSFVKTFLELLINLVKIEEDRIDCQLLFPVLSSFLAELDREFLEESFMTSIVNFFHAFSDDGHRLELVEKLYLNLDMISKWPVPSKVLWFSDVLKQLAESDPLPFYIPLASIIGSILYIENPESLVKDPTNEFQVENPESLVNDSTDEFRVSLVKNAADAFLVSLIERKQDEKAVKILAQFAIGTNVLEHKLHCVDLLIELIQCVPAFFTARYRSLFLYLLEKCGAFHAFALFWRHGQIGISDCDFAYLAIAALKQGSIIVNENWVEDRKSVV
jgi:hypothetical protein